ncbi:metal ABC transporter permease [Corynebacterium sp. MSK218]|uniref:metal ABC transporter permease n=1 Tax=Corynebacterium sp. MSK218 TaxID=3050218 RepID=UPI00254EAFB1|nr:metal ABC transporter permease [Corynebacterium sp. MSK218]MDK8762301.1 metal ABC transporter permease [Corynebacterium sp. MSK218]
MMLLLTAPYLQRALVFLLILAVAGAVVSVVVNLRRMEFTVEATVHSIFPGIVVGLALGGIAGILPGAALVGAVTVAVFVALNARQGGSSDDGTAVVLTSMYGLGVVISLRHGDTSGQLEALMFGRLLDLTAARLYPAAAFCILAALILAATWRYQVAVAFDPVAAAAHGIPVTAVTVAAHAAVAMVVVAASAAVGVLLVLSFLVIPGLAARLVARGPGSMCLIAAVLSAVAVLAGFLAMLSQTSHQLSPQAMVSLALTLTLIPALIMQRRVQ